MRTVKEILEGPDCIKSVDFFPPSFGFARKWEPGRAGINEGNQEIKREDRRGEKESKGGNADD